MKIHKARAATTAKPARRTPCPATLVGAALGVEVVAAAEAVEEALVWETAGVTEAVLVTEPVAEVEATEEEARVDETTLLEILEELWAGKQVPNKPWQPLEQYASVEPQYPY